MDDCGLRGWSSIHSILEIEIFVSYILQTSIYNESRIGTF